MKPPHDIDDFLPILAFVEARAANDSNASALVQELRRILKLGIDAEALLIALDGGTKFHEARESEPSNNIWRQFAYLISLRHFVRAQVGRGPIHKALSDLMWDLLDKTRAGHVRTGAAAWIARVKCLMGLIVLEEVMTPADALDLVLSKKKVLALISAYQKHDGERVVDHGQTIKKWRKQLEAGATGHPYINRFYADLVASTRQSMEKLTKEQMRQWAENVLAQFT